MKAQCPKCKKWRAVFDKQVVSCSNCGDTAFSLLDALVKHGKEGKRKNKYNAKKVKADGYTFDSQAEYRRYLELKQLFDAGVIGSLEVHPKYSLLAPFTDSFGVKHPGITYEADFCYYDEDGQFIAEDVKGVKTAVFKLKRQLFCEQHPEIKLVLVPVR